MNRARDQNVTEDSTRTEEPAGKVEFDSRGKAIWRWARDKLDSTSVLLKRLENKDLALEPTQKVPVIGAKQPAAPAGKTPAAAGKAPVAPKRASLAVEDDDRAGRASGRDAFGRPKSRDGGGGFDPYNSR